MDKYIYTVQLQSVVKTIELEIGELESDKCADFFFSKGS